MPIIPDAGQVSAHDFELTDDDVQLMDLLALAVVTGTLREARR